MSVPNFSSLARLEVPEKFLWGGGWWWGVHSHFHVKPNRCVVLCWGWGFDNLKTQLLAGATKKESQAKILSETANLISLEDPAPGPGVHGKAREKACE